MMTRLLLLLCLAVTAPSAFPQSAVFLVRHAERADPGRVPHEKDPGLSEQGHARAALLARLLRDADIRHVFVTEFKRTRDTAAPTARAAGLEPVVVPGRDLAPLVEKIRAAQGNTLVVGHSNTVLEIARALGVDDLTFTIGENDYDNLLVVFPGNPARLVRLRY